MRFVRLSLSLGSLALWILACSGATHGENEAGADVWMEGAAPTEETGAAAHDGFCQYNGSIGADDRYGHAYVMVSSVEVDCDEVGYGTALNKTLLRVSEERGAAEVMDLTGHDDVRTLYPERGLLVMAERDGADVLYLFDGETLQPAASLSTEARYHGTRMSPSRRFVAVGDNVQDPIPVHIIDTERLEVHELDVGGVALEAMWLEQRDALAALVSDEEVGSRLLLWEVDPALDASVGLGAPLLEIEAPDHFFQVDHDYTWIGVAPDDAVVVFPVLHRTRGDELLLLRPDSGEVQVVANAHGPVGFSPDGDTIVSYRYEDADGDGHGDEGGQASLLLIDVETLAETLLPIPFEGWPEYFVTREGRLVVVASMGGDEDLVLFDMDSGSATVLGGASLGLHEFVSRVGHGELWLVDDRQLWRLDLWSQEIRPVSLGFVPAHINLLPSRDRILLDEADDTVLSFLDPESEEVVMTVDLDVRR